MLQVTGGRNGYGAKLANIFSTEFTVETCDGARQKQYRQRFHENMGAKDAPKVGAPADVHTVKQGPWGSTYGLTKACAAWAGPNSCPDV